MRIAILGWGSLLWDPHSDFDSQHNSWQSDGPCLSLEFCRVSKSRKGGLTLVLDTTHGNSCRVAYAYSKRINPDDSICDLGCREGTSLSNIGFYFADGSRKNCRDDGVLASIKDWILKKKIDVAIWTDLLNNFEEKSSCRKPFSIESAMRHLRDLDSTGKTMAAEYFWRAPAFVQTPIRKAIESELWYQKHIAKVCQVEANK